MLASVEQSVWTAEHEVLGSILLDDKLMDEVEPIISDLDFESPKHRIIYKTMVRLYEQNHPINVVSITELLMKEKQLDNIGGVAYLTDLSSGVVTTSRLSYFANLVKENAVKRKLNKVVEGIKRKIIDGDFEDTESLISYSEEAISQVRSNKHKGLSPISDRLMNHIERLEQAKTSNGIKGHSWGFPTADKLTSGLCAGQLIIIAARPGVGKTTMLLHLAKEIGIKKGLPVGFFALEMTEDELVDKLLSNMTGVPHTLINNGHLDNHWCELAIGFEDLSKSPLNIDDTPAVTMNYIAAEARKMKRKYGELGAIMVDYLQLIEPSSDRKAQTRDQEIGLMTRRAKQLAKELECPVIMACQLNREVEKRNIKKPVLSDLRESGNIEQDANMVCFLHNDPDGDGEKIVNGEPIGEVELIIAKNRSGGVGSVKLLFRRAYQRFVEMTLERER